jgi:DNA-binding NtrC family response regulator
MNQPLRVLIVEDSTADVELLLRALRRGGYEATYEVVETPTAMRTALARQDWDVITSDHAMPHFSAPAALALAKEVCPDVPFFIVSGEIDLNLAVSLMKGGHRTTFRSGNWHVWSRRSHAKCAKWTCGGSANVRRTRCGSTKRASAWWWRG